ncbi:MAG TPA: GNAT family N-acetyltransferase [bacterium]|nr:GNAT family N-acetyltransferase [bacterium]
MQPETPGPKVLIRLMTTADANACSAIVCKSIIGERYGFSLEPMARTLSAAIEAGGELFVAELAGAVAGFAWIDARGAFSSAPYLRLIAVDETLRGSGVGAALLSEFEARTACIGRDWCLLVSDFNLPAQSFYEKKGYRRAGALSDFARPGITEILMVKKRQPASV